MDIQFFYEYMNILLKNGCYEADIYKDKFIPNRLYKYFPPEDNRINALINNQLWLAKYTTFNDPNEFSFMTLNKEYFNNPKFQIDFSNASKAFKNFKDTISISCFTTSSQNNIFWKNYANEFTGFCVEYEVKNKKYLYPVIYNDYKIDISEYFNEYFIKLYNTVIKERQLEIEWHEPVNLIHDDEDIKDVSFLYFNYCVKEKKWCKENEFRIIFSNLKPQTNDGQLISYKYLGLTPINIYFYSEKCKPDIISKLKQIALF